MQLEGVFEEELSRECLARMTWSDTHNASALATWVANRQT